MTWKNRFNLWFGRERERGTWKKHQNGTVLRPCHNFEKEKKLNMETRDRRFFDLVWTAFRSAIEDCRQKRKQQPKGVPSIRSCFLFFFSNDSEEMESFVGIERVRHERWSHVADAMPKKIVSVKVACLFVCSLDFLLFFIIGMAFSSRDDGGFSCRMMPKKIEIKTKLLASPFRCRTSRAVFAKKNYGEFFLFSFLASALFEGLLFRFLFLFSFSFVRCCASRAKAIEWNKKNMKPQSVLITLMNIM